ncbi:MAG: long-chain-fatty-acid--CoA ligase [Bacillota bacterium]
MRIGDIPRKNARLVPDKPAVIFDNQELTFKDLNERVNRLANSLASRGVGPGTRAAIISLNRPEFIETYYALAKLGAIVVPINNRLSSFEVIYQLQDAGAEIIFFDGECKTLVNQVCSGTPSGYWWVGYNESPSWADVYEDMVALGGTEEPNHDVDPDQAFLILYTSGTTGRPKGVELTHRNWITNCYHTCITMKLQKMDVFLGATPMFHSSGAGRLFATHFVGATYAGIPRFEVNEFLEAIPRWRITQMLLVPTMISMAVKELRRRPSPDLSTLQLLYYGGSPIDPYLLKEAIERFGCHFGQGYALTEASLMVTFLTPDDHRKALTNKDLSHRLYSAGCPVPGVMVALGKGEQIWDEPEKVGEIMVRGLNVMKGYWQRQEATAEALRGGWLRTGDAGYLDADGYLYIVDRVKDMIISGGENIFSQEIEEVLVSHPAVAEAAVIGVPDEFWGEAVRAFVVLDAGHKATPEELVDFCVERLARFKKPRVVVIVPSLPKTSLGKIMKNVLRQPFWVGRERKIN